jgi:hypothetical protein
VSTPAFARAGSENCEANTSVSSASHTLSRAPIILTMRSMRNAPAIGDAITNW